ncbi:MAG TPA: CYCXC family (seleno)protein [Terriglobales bacterium]|nr:CYCXC family (seleno)protein [Terriglobales bacterium]
MTKGWFLLGFIFLVAVTLFAPMAISSPGEEDEAQVPAFHTAAPIKGAKLPDILVKEQLWGSNAQYAVQVHAYELAAKIPSVLYQQPCYCYCDRSMGHKSLHSCFENVHGAQCATCMKELYYTYLMHKKGKTAAEIRRGIIKGEWQQVDLQMAAAIN